jgi:hypothetical protein
MATAAVYFRFDGPGNGWGAARGTGSSKGADSNTAKDHAERQAFRMAIKTLQAWYDGSHAGFPGQGAEVKIWVDNIVCPQCQLWIIAGVLRNLSQFTFQPKLFVEVKNMGGTRITQAITRDYVWPDGIGHRGYERLADLKRVTMSD